MDTPGFPALQLEGTRDDILTLAEEGPRDREKSLNELGE